MTSEEKFNEGRRTFLKSAALLGGTAVFTGLAGERYFQQLDVWATSSSFPSGADGAHHFKNDYDVYQLAHPENIIYSACLMCHNDCGIKVKIQHGTANGQSVDTPVKIDGNPYMPTNLLPWLPTETPPTQAALWDGKLCPRGQAGIQAYADPYRIVKVLKRAGPRGSNKWTSIPFDQAITEIVNGGQLFSSIGETQTIEGLKDVLALTDPALAASMAADVQKVKSGAMGVGDFKQKYANNLDVLIDPDHPDLGPKNNQFVFMGSRIEGSRVDFSQRFTFYGAGSINWMDHFPICELSHHVAWHWASAQYTTSTNSGDGPGAAVNGWTGGGSAFKPDYSNAMFLIAWGTSPIEASFGPVNASERVTAGLAYGSLKIAAIDPRFSKTAAKAWRWLPIKLGGDLPLAMAMIQWIIQNKAYDSVFLGLANKAAATAKGYLDWIGATWLVRIESDGRASRFVRASDLGLDVPSGSKADDYFVAMVNGQPTALNAYDTSNAVVGDLFVNTTVSGFQAKSALQLLSEAASSKSFEDWCALAGVDPAAATEVVQEFTSHGHQAVVDYYRGPVAHYNGSYAGLAVGMLNLLIGNPDWKGGLTSGATGWGGAGSAFDVTPSGIANKLTPFGINQMRAGYFYDKSTLFDGFPAKRPWFPFAWGDPTHPGGYHDVLPSAQSGYPYPIKILLMHENNTANMTPANQGQISVLLSNAIPLVVAVDIVIGDTSMYADYVFPDLSYLERWMVESNSPQGMSTPAKYSIIRQPAAVPLTETVTVGGEEMPISMEAMLIALAGSLDMPGFGPNGFGQGVPLTRAEHFHLREVANVAVGGGKNDEVPDASADEITLFTNTRQFLPSSVFDLGTWQETVGSTLWPKVVYVLNRGGRAGPISAVYNGDYMGYPFGKLWNIFIEPFALTKDSITGQYYSGIPPYYPPSYSDGTPIDYTGYPFQLHTYKTMLVAKRTIPEYWSQLSILPYPHVLVNSQDAASLSLNEGDFVRLVSPAEQSGELDLGPLGKYYIEGPVRIIEGQRPGTVSIIIDYGHWGWGASDATIDGEVIVGDPRIKRGTNINPLLLTDKVNIGTGITDPIGGNASYWDTQVKLVKISSPPSIANGQYPTSDQSLWQ